MTPQRRSLVPLALAGLLLSAAALAHPTGSMVVVGDLLLFSYVCPVDTADHRACVMAWDEVGGVRPWLVSERDASDWMIAVDGDGVLLVERYYDQGRQLHRARLLRAEPLGEPTPLGDWYDDTLRFGEAGFAPLSDGSVVFVRYPDLWIWREGSDPEPWRPWPTPVRSVRAAGPDRLLIRAEDEAWLTTPDGEIVRGWEGLLDPEVDAPPFLGNVVFDASFDGEALWLAYWGQRRFDAVREGGRETVLQLEAPLLPHAVAAGDGGAFLLASSLDPGSAIRPRLWRLSGGELVELWSER